MDKMREEFESWAVSTKDHFGVPFFTIKNANGKYVDHGTEISWQAWQASRQALVVDVESLPSASYTDDGVVYRSHVESMIENAGVGLK